jgi:uncharacterized protein YicC (UPF0701 family)
MSDRRSQKSVDDLMEEKGVLDYHREAQERAPEYAYLAVIGAMAELRKRSGEGTERRRDLRRETDRLNDRMRQQRLALPGDDDDLNELVAWVEDTLKKVIGETFAIADKDGVPNTLSAIVGRGDLELWEKAQREIREFALAKKVEGDLVNECARVSDVVGRRLRKVRGSD